MFNTANLRDLIAVTGPVAVLKLDSNHRVVGPYKLEIWWMTSINKRTPHLCYIKLWALFLSQWWNKTGVTVPKCPFRVKIGNLMCDLQIRQMTSEDNMTPLLCYVKLCASFLNRQWVKIEITVRKCSTRVQMGDFVSRLTLQYDGWTWKAKK